MTFFIPISMLYFGLGWLAGVITVLFVGWMLGQKRRGDDLQGSL